MDIAEILGFWPVRAVVGFLLITGLLLTGALVLLYTERKIQGFIQDRLGPHHVGKWGLLQPIADGGKLLLKEDIIPKDVDRWMFVLAPLVFFIPVMATFIVMPFATGLQVAELNIGILYIIAISSFGVIGVLMAGWGSNNKYSLIGGMRGAAQMVSYELPMIMTVIPIVLLAGSMAMGKIVETQAAAWFILIQPLGFLVYFTCGLAETNRTPFDLPEAESELVAGYLTEYSGMRWASFMLGEYCNMTTICGIATALFLGGGSLPFVTLAGPLGMVVSALVFIGKVYVLLWTFQWIRATLPRLRADQLMAFCWKVLVPVTLINIFVTGGLVVFLPDAYIVPVAVVNWIMLVVYIAALPRLVGSIVRPRVQVTKMSEVLAGGRA